MKKQLPWIILGAIILIGIIWLIRRNMKNNIAKNGSEISDTITDDRISTGIAATPTIITQYVQRCPCLKDPYVQSLIHTYKTASIMSKPSLKIAILNQCSCVPNTLLT